KETAELKARTEQAAQEPVEKAASKPGEAAQQMLGEQQQLNAKVDAVKDALRADANQQNVMEQEGRERARDADDALALLKEPPPKAEEALTKAAQTLDEAERKEALQAAAQPQQKLADALSQLATHYENVEQGKPAESRLALRATEQETGIKAEMDRQAARAEELTKMAAKSPDELLKQLEAALAQNPTMQKELSSISQNTLDAAASQLSEASQQESQTAQAVDKAVAEQKAKAATMASAPPVESADDLKKKLETQTAEVAQLRQERAAKPPGSPEFAQANDKVQAKKAEIAQTQAAVAKAPNPGTPPPDTTPTTLAAAAQQQQPIAQAAKSAGESMERAGRHEQRLENQIAGERIEALGTEVKETAMNEVAAAAQTLTQAAQAGPAEQMDSAKQAVSAASAELKQELAQLEAAASAPPAGAAQMNAQPPSPREAAASTPPTNAQPPAPGTSPQPSPNALPEVRSIGDLASTMPPGTAEPATSPGTPAAPATPQEQVWMARTLDALDAALNSDPSAPSAKQPGSESAPSAESPKPGQPGQPGQQPGSQPQPSKSNAMEQAQQALAQAAQAAAAAMRAARAPTPQAPPGVPVGQGQEQLASESGAAAEAAGQAMGQLPGAKSKGGEWGKLPKKMAEQLTRGQSEAVAGEYRNQVETYYRVIAEKSKKP
ncbi:MAG TPA: hypothetical protein VGO90_16025, partial [Chthoniobacteraceae bacterium]|nr:hypothetical protein [Chthoniobacteraceae bacterium]